MPALDDPIIDRYLDALWLEKGLADNSREAYRSDLALFNGWLEERGVRLATAGREIILDHLAWRLNNGYKARSTARFLSGLRGFYRYLLREGEIAVEVSLVELVEDHRRHALERGVVLHHAREDAFGDDLDAGARAATRKTAASF